MLLTQEQEKREAKMMFVQNLTIEEQNRTMHGNPQAIIKEKILALKKTHVAKAQVDLDKQIRADEIALQQQRYLIESVIETYKKTKKQDLSRATKQLQHLDRQKWIKKHQRKTEPSHDYSDEPQEPSLFRSTRTLPEIF